MEQRVTSGKRQQPLLSVEDLAAYLQIPVKTIYNWNSAGTGPRYVRIGKHVRYQWEDVVRWVGRPSG